MVPYVVRSITRIWEPTEAFELGGKRLKWAESDWNGRKAFVTGGKRLEWAKSVVWECLSRAWEKEKEGQPGTNRSVVGGE